MKRKTSKKRNSITLAMCFFWPKSDDWSPNFIRDTVEVKLYDYHTGMIRIVVRGADDTLMEKDFHVPEKEVGVKILELKDWLEHDLPNPLTKACLRAQGFSFA